jgi:hypothetical protein
MRGLYVVLLVVVSALVLSWGLPSVVRMATMTSPRYPFVYYSSLLQDFLVREGSGDGMSRYVDSEGGVYSREAFDSLTPLFSYRQLMVSGSLPDSVLGVAVDPQELRVKAFTWRYNPRVIDRPVLPLYFMYESASGRVNLESPVDVFRLGDDIVFVDKLTNAVNEEKSALFRSALEGAGFVFPARSVWGNLSAKKAYDVGYFVVDDRGGLFHLMMAHGLPVVRDTRLGDRLEVACFSVLEVADRSIYGFLVARDGGIYAVYADGCYSVGRLDIPRIDVEEHSVMLMANFFYRIVQVSTLDSMCCYVLDGGTLGLHEGPYVVRAAEDRWGSVAGWLFPVYLSFSSRGSEYLAPVFHVSFGWAVVVSVLMGVGYFFVVGRRRPRPPVVLRVVGVCVIVLFGVPGLIACLLFRG